MTSPVRIDHFRHAVVTTDAQGNSFVHNRVAGDDPEVLVAHPPSLFSKIDAVVTGAITGFMVVAACFILKWTFQAVAWAVGR